MDANPLDSLPPPSANPLDSLPPPQVAQSAPQHSYSFADFAKDYGSAAVRPIVKAVAGLPLMAMDAGVAARNLVTGNVDPSSLKTLLFGSPKNTGAADLPSATFNQALDTYTRAPTTTAGKIAEFGSTVLAGARLPGPTEIGGGAYKAPDSFVNASTAVRQGVLERAQQEGYVVPPASSNPTFTNRFLEGISGKLKLQQEAAARNQPITDMLAARALGQNPDSPLTQGALSTIRAEAAQNGYSPLRAVGDIPTDAKFLSDLNGLTQTAQGANRSFPGIQANSPIFDVVSALSKPKFDSSDGLDAISLLRSQADDAFRAGNGTLGTQYKSAAKAVEDMIERHLGSQEDSAGLLDSFRAARQQIAQTYTAGKAIVGDTGSSNAIAYAQALKSGKPLVDDQRTIASFASQFRKAAAFQTESTPSISPLDAYGSAIAAGASHSAAPLLVPLTRIGLREYLLSPAGQARALPQAFEAADPVMGGLASLGVQVSNYLSN